MTDEELGQLIESAVRRLLSRADPATVGRFVRGEADLAFVEPSAVAVLIAGKPIDEAYDALMAQTAAVLKTYFKDTLLPSVVAPVIPPNPKKGVAQGILTARILVAEYGQAYEPPPPLPGPKASTPRPTKPAAPFDTGETVAALEAATTETEARAVLKKVTGKPNNKALASKLGVEFAKDPTITELREAIYQQVVAPRLARGVYMSLGART